jgi:crotonobetainyl-CoA:carnitine CoA-transferase CaiB-like acyl-CoA transferase
VSDASNAAVLCGVRVLDVASYIAAPVAATLMADYGADVIKVEAPHGDAYRQINNNPGLPDTSAAFHWHVTNRNKRGLALDLTNIAGRQVLERLVAGTDVFITNFPLAARKRLQLNYEDIQALNPKLIYASLSAYGERGHEAPNPGFDSTAYWARSGLMDMVRPDPQQGPARSMPGQGDHPTGVALFGAIMLALFDRQRTGVGQHVHTSLLANGIWANAYAAQAALSGAQMPRRPRREDMPNALTNHYRCADQRWFILTLLNQDRDWPRLLEVLGMPELATDPRFCSRAARNEHAGDLCAVLDQRFAQYALAYWRERLDAAGLVIGIVGANEDIPGDPQLHANGTLRAAEGVDATHVVDSPLWLEGAVKQPVVRAPELGEHRADILDELGLSTDEVMALQSAGAFG